MGRFFEELKRPFFRGDPYFDNFNSPEFNKLINYKDRFGRTALHVHCHPPNPTLVDLLIENGAEVNALDEDGNTPLHKAFLACQQEEYFTEAFSIIKSLLNAKADISIKNNAGKTPLELDDIVSDVLTQLLEHPDS